MISLYARIAGNYFKPVAFRIAYCLIAVLTALAAWRQAVSHDLTDLFPPPVLGFFAFLATVVLADMGVLYLKEQLATWQSSIVPHYRRPHLIVGALFVAIALCGIPLLAHRIARLELFPLIAVCAVGASVAGWLMYDPSIKTILIFFAVLALLCFPEVQQRLVLMMAYPVAYIRLIALLLAGSIALFGWIWWQLAHLREDMPQYRTVVPASKQRAMTEVRGAPQGGALDVVAGLIARYPGWRVAGRYGDPVDSFFGRVAHRRVISAGGWVPWRLGMLWSLALLLMLLCINLAFDANHRMKLEEIAPIVFIISMPAAPIITSSLWMRRASMLPYEITLPASRRSFIRETMVSLVRDYLSCWAGAYVSSFGLLIATNQLGHDGVFEILAWNVFFFSGQVAALAIIAWTLRFRSATLSVVIMVVASALTLPILVGIAHGRLNYGLTIPIYLVGGFVVLFDAYRRWLRVDFE